MVRAIRHSLSFSRQNFSCGSPCWTYPLNHRPLPPLPHLPRNRRPPPLLHPREILLLPPLLPLLPLPRPLRKTLLLPLRTRSNSFLTIVYLTLSSLCFRQVSGLLILPEGRY